MAASAPPPIDRLELVPVRQAAARIGVPSRTLYQRVHAGHWPFWRVGRSVRVRVTDVEHFMKTGEEPAASGAAW